MALAPVVNLPMPRQPDRIAPPKVPVEKVALTQALGAADAPGVIVQLSPEVEWMMKRGIL